MLYASAMKGIRTESYAKLNNYKQQPQLRCQNIAKCRKSEKCRKVSPKHKYQDIKNIALMRSASFGVHHRLLYTSAIHAFPIHNCFEKARNIFGIG
jgi:hypothetical protein